MTDPNTDLATLREDVLPLFFANSKTRGEAFEQAAAIVARVEAELLRLRDNIKAEAVQTIEAKEYGSEQHARAQAAEARCARLQQALQEAQFLLDRESARLLREGRTNSARLLADESAALAGHDTPADSPPIDAETWGLMQGADSQPEEPT